MGNWAVGHLYFLIEFQGEYTPTYSYKNKKGVEPKSHPPTNIILIILK